MSIKTKVWRLAVACAVFFTGAAHGGCLDGGRLVGVNIAGAEFNSKRLPGVMNRDYVYPSKADIAYFAGKGATAIRVPFRWERMQRTLMGELDAAETAAMAAVVAAAQEFDLCVIMDAHNYGSYRGAAIGSDAVPEAAFVDFWTRMAERFPYEKNVALGLMNEPKSLLIANWAAVAQNTVNALRAEGAAHFVLVSGGRWAGVHEWSKVFSGTSNAQAFADFRDPAGRMAIEMHQYADTYFSGTGTTCHPPDRFDNMFRIATEWARETGHKLFLGEFGTPGDRLCLRTLDRILSLMTDGEVWMGWSYWAAGRWWGSYPLSIQPSSTGKDKPQMRVLSRYLNP